MSDPVYERRALDRHPIRVPIDVEQIGQGMTCDVSVSGIAFELDRQLEPGAPITFNFSVNLGGLQLHCVGRVVRVEQRGDKAFTAATIEDMIFRPMGDH